MQTLCLRTFLASYSFTSSSPLSYLVPSQSAHSFFSLQPSFLRGSLVLMVIYQVVSSFSILSFTSLFFFYQSHNMIFTGLSGLIGYLPSCKLILYPLLHFTLFLSVLLFLFGVSALYSYLPLLLPHQHHNMIFTGLFGLIDYLPSCKLILYPLLHFTLFFSILLFLSVSPLFILIFLSFFHDSITT